MAVPTLISELSTTAANNPPAGTEGPVDGDNHLRAHAAFIAQLEAQKLDIDGSVTPTANQPMGTYKHTGAGTATAAGEYVTWNQTGVKFPAIGVGVASSAWNSAVSAVDMGGRGAVVGASYAGLYYNTYMNSSSDYKAKEAAYGVKALASDDGFTVDVAASAAAGATQTFAAAFGVDTSKRIYGKDIHNNAAGVTGTTNQYIGSGTYTPTATNVANMAAMTPNQAQWIRVGNVVSVSGSLAADPTSASTASGFRMTLPVPSNLASTVNCNGSGTFNEAGQRGSVAILGNPVEDEVEFSFFPLGVASALLTYSYSYVVL